jgi:hypothetical protein
MEIDGYKFVDPEESQPTPEDIATAHQFLINNGYGVEDEDFSVGVDLVSRMLATGEETLCEAPIGWRFASDLDAPDERCVVMLSQRHQDRVVKDLMVVASYTDSENIRDAFMKDQSA